MAECVDSDEEWLVQTCLEHTLKLEKRDLPSGAVAQASPTSSQAVLGTVAENREDAEKKSTALLLQMLDELDFSYELPPLQPPDRHNRSAPVQEISKDDSSQNTHEDPAPLLTESQVLLAMLDPETDEQIAAAKSKAAREASSAHAPTKRPAPEVEPTHQQLARGVNWRYMLRPKRSTRWESDQELCDVCHDLIIRRTPQNKTATLNSTHNQ